MIDVQWLEQTQADLPPEDDWLSAGEAARLTDMRFPKRRGDWRTGRWTAKNAVAIHLGLPRFRQVLAAIEIRSALCGAPEVFLADKPLAVSISLTHRDGRAACAVASSNTALGCDLEVIEEHSDGFATDYFAAEEQELIKQGRASDCSMLMSLIWSAKESALKALRVGLQLDTRRVIVNLGAGLQTGDGIEDPSRFRPSCGPDIWHPLSVRYTEGQIFHGWWQNAGTFLRTLVAAPPSTPHFLSITDERF